MHNLLLKKMLLSTCQKAGHTIVYQQAQSRQKDLADSICQRCGMKLVAIASVFICASILAILNRKDETTELFYKNERI
jgi:hypothetical protein